MYVYKGRRATPSADVRDRARPEPLGREHKTGTTETRDRDHKYDEFRERVTKVVWQFYLKRTYCTRCCFLCLVIVIVAGRNEVYDSELCVVIRFVAVIWFGDMRCKFDWIRWDSVRFPIAQQYSSKRFDNFHP